MRAASNLSSASVNGFAWASTEVFVLVVAVCPSGQAQASSPNSQLSIPGEGWLTQSVAEAMFNGLFLEPTSRAKT